MIVFVLLVTSFELLTLTSDTLVLEPCHVEVAKVDAEDSDTYC